MTILRGLLALTPFTLVGSVGAQTVQLRFRPPVGKTVSYIANVSMNMKGTATPKPAQFTQRVPFTMRIASRKGNTTTLESKIGQVRVDLPAGSPMAAGKAQMEKAVSGRSGSLTVDELGNLDNPAAAMSMTGGLGKGAQGIAFPAKAVKVGETWGGTVDLGRLGGSMTGGGMSGKIPVVYRLAALKNGVATITMVVRGKANLAGAQPMKIDANYRGSFDVDAATGLLKRMQATSDNNLEMKGKGTMQQHIVVTMRAG